jgi:hypothetical protein
MPNSLEQEIGAFGPRETTEKTQTQQTVFRRRQFQVALSI